MLIFLVTFNGSVLITSSPSDRVLVGSAVALSCSGNLSSSIDDPSLLSIMWYHAYDGTTAQLNSDVSLSNGGTAFTSTLTIDPFTISSVGRYRCTATIDGSTANSHNRILRAKCKYTCTKI